MIIENRYIKNKTHIAGCQVDFGECSDNLSSGPNPVNQAPCADNANRKINSRRRYMTLVNQLLKRTGREQIRFDCGPASSELPSRTQNVHGPNHETGPFSTFPYAKPSGRAHVWTIAGQAYLARDSAQEAAERAEDSMRGGHAAGGGAPRTRFAKRWNTGHAADSGLPGRFLRSRTYSSLLRVRTFRPDRASGVMRAGAHIACIQEKNKAKKFVCKDFIYPVSCVFSPYADSHATGCAGA